MFPNGWFQGHAKAVPAALRECVLNRTLIDKKTNIRIGKKAPSVYLAEIAKELKPQEAAELLRSHLLPEAKDGPLWKDDFEGFLEAREAAILGQIHEATHDE